MFHSQKPQSQKNYILVYPDFQIVVCRFWFPVSDYKFLNSIFRFPVSDFWFPVSEFKIIISRFKYLASGFLFPIFEYGYPHYDFQTPNQKIVFIAIIRLPYILCLQNDVLITSQPELRRGLCAAMRPAHGALVHALVGPHHPRDGELVRARWLIEHPHPATARQRRTVMQPAHVAGRASGGGAVERSHTSCVGHLENVTLN